MHCGLASPVEHLEEYPEARSPLTPREDWLDECTITFRCLQAVPASVRFHHDGKIIFNTYEAACSCICTHTTRTLLWPSTH